MRNQLIKIRSAIKAQFRKIIHIGVRDDLTIIAREEIKLINTIAVFSIVLISTYAITNLFIYPRLGLLNILTVVGVFFVFKLNYQGRYRLSAFWFLSLLAVCFSVANFIYPKSTEYYLLCLATVGLLLIRKNYALGFIILIVLLATIIPKFYTIDSLVVNQVSEIRIIINSVLGLLCMLGIINYLKFIQTEYQNQLSDQKDKLAESNRAMEKLFAMLSHDIRSPLLGCKQAVELLLLKELNVDKQTNMLHNINKQLTAICENVDGFMVWSKNNMQKIVPLPEDVNILACISYLEDEIVLQTNAKNIVLKKQIDDDLTVFADPQHLNLIFRNLLVNAVKFSHPNSRIDIVATCTDQHITIAVIDYGVGIPESKIRTLFQHIQEPAWGTIGEKGTGLGLTLVNELVSLNNGTINVTSQVGEKTVFLVMLPNDTIAQTSYNSPLPN